MRIPLSSVKLMPNAIELVKEALASGWISGTGEYVQRFEHDLAIQVHRKHAIACSNGTVAVEVALRALGIGPGDEVVVPALTFVAPAAAVRSVGAMPVFADVDEESWTLDVLYQLNDRVKAIIAVDLLGHPFDYHYILSNRLRGAGIYLIEDAAEAHGARCRDDKVGSLGDISTFSFHANKTVTTGEGGAIITDDSDLAHQVRLRVNHGMTTERPYWHDVIGTNARMTNLTAAIGVGHVYRWDDLVAARNLVAKKYDERLVDLFDQTELYRRPVATWATEACWLYTIAHPNRQPIIDALRERGIDSRPIWTALPDLPLYRESCRGEYPVARKIAAEAFWLPTWAGMPDDVINEVCEVVREAVRQPIR